MTDFERIGICLVTFMPLGLSSYLLIQLGGLYIIPGVLAGITAITPLFMLIIIPLLMCAWENIKATRAHANNEDKLPYTI